MRMNPDPLPRPPSPSRLHPALARPNPTRPSGPNCLPSWNKTSPALVRYRALKRGLTADQIAAELEVSTSNFVWNYDRQIKALLDGDLPTAPTVALGSA